MAKKTSSNAIRKIDDQINSLESKGGTVPKKKSTSRNGQVRDKVVVTPTKRKKTTTTKKTSSSKNVRGDVVVAKKRKTTTRTIQNENLKDEIKDLKNKETVLVPSEKKDLAAEVNKILGIEEEPQTTPTSFVPLDLREEVVVPTEKKEIEKPVEVLEEPKETTEEKVKEFLEKADELEEKAPKHETSLDDIDVIKFDKDANGTKPLTVVAKKKGNLKKKTPIRKREDFRKKQNELDNLDKIEEYNIVEDFKKEIPLKKEPLRPAQKPNDFKRKRKGRGYIVNIPKKPYKELESDIRSLYDRVNDVTDDFETTKVPQPKKKVLFGKKEKTEETKKPFLFGKKKKVEQTPEAPRKVKVVKKKVKPVYVEPEEEPGKKKRFSILDHISQKVLNFFLIVLSIIFFLMVIAFIAFVVYVSTF